MRNLALSLVLLLGSVAFAADQVLTGKVLPCVGGGSETLFTWVNSMVLEGERLLVLENLRHRVVELRVGDGRLTFVRKIGRTGRGPGDLNLPASLSLDGERIAVKDEEGISFFDSGAGSSPNGNSLAGLWTGSFGEGSTTTSRSESTPGG